MQRELKTELHHLFPSVVQICDLPDHETLNLALMQEIDQIRSAQPNTKPRSWACDLYTTIGTPHALLQHPGFADLLSAAQANLLEYANAMRLDVERQPPRIHECWLNIYGRGQSQEIHLHRNSVFSGIYYVRVPPGSGATLFYSPDADVMLEPRALEGNALNAKVSGFQPQEGRMLLFRSHLRHSVMPGDQDGERVTIAFNAVM